MSRSKASPRSASVPAKASSAKMAEAASRRVRELSILLKHASESTRLQMLLELAEGELHVGAISDRIGQSQPSISHHLALLRHGGIVTPRRAGKNSYYSLTDDGKQLAKVAGRLLD